MTLVEKNNFLSIALVHPDIPQNTGAIARTCAALDIPLHLIKPMGFSIDEKKVRRAGLDYWPFVTVIEHENWDAFLATQAGQSLYYLSTKGSKSLFETNFSFPATLVFGSETKGLPQEIRDQAQNLIKIPMRTEFVRSLNLSNAATLVAYEALRQYEINTNSNE
jgi:tRNA (cytidine/uridine-2'-O-)-methyltransferase